MEVLMPALKIYQANIIIFPELHYEEFGDLNQTH